MREESTIELRMDGEALVRVDVDPSTARWTAAAEDSGRVTPMNIDELQKQLVRSFWTDCMMDMANRHLLEPTSMESRLFAYSDTAPNAVRNIAKRKRESLEDLYEVE